MDLSVLQALIPNIAGYFHLAPSTLLFIIAVIVTTANVGGKMIPDNATGALHYVRILCNLIGLYVANRVAPGITVNDVAKQVLGQQTDSTTSNTIENLAQDAEALIPTVLDGGPEAPPEPIPVSFPGLNRGPDGKFLPKDPNG